MTNEESYLNSRISRDNHFRVPDGYFDRLTAEVMASLPEKKPARRVLLRPIMAVASVACVAIIGTIIYFSSQANNDEMQSHVAVATTMPLSDSYIDQAADYAMIDHQDIYGCLTSEY
jgi:hypothetical protein